MEHENWKAVSDQFLTEESKADFAKSRQHMPADFDQAAYSAKWADLTGRIQAALPMDPASEQAKAFYAEWQALIAPFKAMATPAMMQGVTKMYDKMDQWQGQQQAPFSPEVWAFIKSVGECGKAG